MQEAPVPWLAVAPFVILLLGIAILPLIRGHWWEKNRNKALFTALVAVPAAAWILFLRAPLLAHAAEEYVAFIILLGSLYVTAGGLVVRGEIRASPFANAGILAGGAILASLIGTTGASMLLIRPFLRANRVRDGVRHLPVFFIFIVSNAGGLLTPLGDPPLFLGFLRGVPFTWTLRLFPEWMFSVGVLITVFFAIDWWTFRQGGGSAELDRKPVSVAGLHNLIFLAMIVGSAAFLPAIAREATMLAAAAGSLYTTRRELREENGFTYNPIAEVAILFLGIFITMQPALELLRALGPRLGVDTPGDFYWASGLLSSFLDNAPTYLTFFTIAQSVPLEGARLIAGVPEPFLIAISLGSVLMGANTYIGNGPNFMVKAIADEAGFRTPSFFGYMLWSIAILGPIWLLIDLLLIGG
ncbi:MAG: sodium:proton antiporter [Deltaproteobacteria bacterium]|nr:sodium:proton antiporter [Deltaproteobacteria bacterium]